MVKNAPTKQKTWVQSLGQEDSLGEGNGNSFQYSCLENSTEVYTGAWQATVNGVTKSRTQLNDYHQALLAECELSCGICDLVL